MADTFRRLKCFLIGNKGDNTVGCIFHVLVNIYDFTVGKGNRRPMFPVEDPFFWLGTRRGQPPLFPSH